MDVTFIEDKPYFTKTYLPGESKKIMEDGWWDSGQVLVQDFDSGQIQSLETKHTRHEAPDFNVYSKRKRSTVLAHAPISEIMTVQEALNSKPRKDAMNEELQAFKKNKTWEVVDLPQGKKTVGCRWIYIIKYKVDRTIERYKVRLVAKRYTQTYGIDYQETFALKEIMSIGVFWIMFQKGKALAQDEDNG
uniref:Reverse transcriptase Ty1/copia-type domain-containing protein n=1 Tax=Vitis vinifera TaxID=29760 RepID=A5AQF2_VITVI|nr:hypothetical protein VITISV_014072 [Vitis vinifera]